MNHLSVWVSDEWSESISVIVSGLMGFIGFEIRSTPENRQKPICRLNYTFPFSTSAGYLHLRWLTHKHTQMYTDTLHCLIFHTQRHHVFTSVGRDSSYLWLRCVDTQHKQMRQSQWNITTQSRTALNMCFDYLGFFEPLNLKFLFFLFH